MLFYLAMQVKSVTHPREESRPDLFFGLIGAVGTTLSILVDALRSECSALGYEVVPIRLSDLLPKGTSPEGEDDRINALMDAGNELRRSSKDNAAVLKLGILELQHIRSSHSRKPQTPKAFVFWSMKHPAEIEALRQIYKASSHIISVYSPKHVRRGILRHKIQKHKPTLTKKDLDRKVDDLIDRDQNESEVNYGQNVRDAFCLADLFIDGSGDIRSQIGRYVRLLFGDPFITPTEDEYGMFHAKAASLRSADLSRQVGAMILSPGGSHLAAGCNEVPKPGGGHFWPDQDDEAQDDRDFRLGSDANAMMRSEMLCEVVDVLKKRSWLTNPLNAKATTQLVAELLKGSRPNLADTRIANVIEYGRIVHAEMSAITDAAKRGVALKDSKLVCTTFPCHMCTRHIIAAGISEVVYIEPYPKSLAVELYGRSVRLDDEKAEHADKRVHYRPFIGVAPERYSPLFSYRKRKDSEGFVREWKPSHFLAPILFEARSVYLMAESMYALAGNIVRGESRSFSASGVRKRTQKRPRKSEEK